MKRTYKDNLRDFYERLRSDPTLFNNDTDFDTVYKKFYPYRDIPTVRSTQNENYMREMQKRADNMKVLYESGKTFNEIGLEYKISRERVRQILERWFPDMPIRKRIFITKEPQKCERCGNEFISGLTNGMARYCSKQCRTEAKKKFYTIEEWKERNRIRSRIQYHKIKERMKVDSEYADRMRKRWNKRHKEWYHKHKNLPV